MRLNDRETYMLCCDCGYAVKKKTMFIKSYKHTAICLCRKCAKKLAKEILGEVEQCETNEKS